MSTLPSVDTLTKELIENRGRHDYFGLRKNWSWFLMGAMAAMILFQMGLTIAIGKGCLDFEKYSVLISLVVGENFLQIIGMCIIVVKFLFKDNQVSA